MNSAYLIISIGIMGIVTFFTRLFPFLFFIKKDPPPVFLYLEKTVPPMIMLILVIYSVKDTALLSFPYGLPEFFSILVVSVLYLWKKNTFLSIASGTAFYMLLIRILQAP